MEEMSLEQAVKQVQAIEQPEDFTRPFNVSHTRAQAITATAAVAVRDGADWLHTSGEFAWCRRVLLAAACMPRSENFGAVLYDDPGVWSARGPLSAKMR